METGDNAALIAATIKYGDVSKARSTQSHKVKSYKARMCSGIYRHSDMNRVLTLPPSNRQSLPYFSL